MLFIVRNQMTGRTFETRSAFGVSLDIVWRSVKGWFSDGSKVLITSENGESKEFSK